MHSRARTLTLVGGLLVLLLVPVVAALADQPFYLDLFRRIMIFAMAAVSLDLILGFGGMVSFGHAAYLGIGAYAHVYFVQDLGLPWIVSVALAAVITAAAGVVVGLPALRTRGAPRVLRRCGARVAAGGPRRRRRGGAGCSPDCR